ncbi:hypothetical protein N1851_016073 [Merluccius polli]|uniref:Actinodin3 n=1 Tax=Merluccius polli TaxID=89951 RepID=A0AA47P317_MERPO|nr:hypothetical protein N1851_016073 [Merluccius polli]
MLSRVSLLRALCCMVLIPDLLEATSLVKVKDAEVKAAVGSVRIDSARAHDFLAQSRPRRNVEPKWYRNTPDFQSYYKFYNSIGHIEGLYEIDRIRMLYQQMRHLEQVHGPDASHFQNIMGVQTTTSPPTTTLPPTTTQPPPPPTTQNPLADAEVIYLCNPIDTLCKPQIVFMPTGAVPVLCDPRYNPACRPKSKEEIQAAAPPPPPPPPKKAAPPPPPPPPPPANVVKAMEYDCDPYWDPDCLIDHPPRPIKSTPPPPPPPVVVVAPVEEKVEEPNETYPQFDPYDYKRDLYDPFRYVDAAAAAADEE